MLPFMVNKDKYKKRHKANELLAEDLVVYANFFSTKRTRMELLSHKVFQRLSRRETSMRCKACAS